MHPPESTSAALARIYEQTLFIAAPAARVWELLITPAEVSRYYLCPLQTIALHPGGPLLYGTDAGSLITGTILEVEPQRQLVHSFQFAGPLPPGTDAHRPSRVRYAIVPMDAMCELTLTHDEFGADEQTYANVASGWPAILSGLKTLAETGKPLPWPKVDASRA